MESSTDETALRGGKEFNEVIDLLAGGNLLTNHLNAFGKETGGVEQDVVGRMEVVDDFGGEATAF